MAYDTSGNLITDKQQIDISESWDTQAEWEAYQTKNNITINSGILELSESDAIDSADLTAHYDATELALSDGDSVTTWADQTDNGYDLIEGVAPTYIASGIGGNPVVRFDGVDDFLTNANFTLTQPSHWFIVLQVQTIPSSSTGHIFDYDDTGSRNVFRIDGNGDWNIYVTSSLPDGAADTNQNIFNLLFDGANSKIDINGTNQVTGDPGSDGLDGIQVGMGGDNNFIEVDIGEMLAYDMDKSSKESDIESYLSDKWGITI